jgi:lipooligosaccharide transport system ATP-binding protein
LEFLELDDRSGDLVDDLSGGMKRRLVIARGLVNEPDLILLDEPTTGLDPQARHLVWARLRQLHRTGITQLLTTHFMDEAEQLCDRIIVMDRGRIIAEGSPSALLLRYSSREVVELSFGDREPEHFGERLAGVIERYERLPDRLLLYANRGDAVVQHLHDSGYRPETVLVRRCSLEDVFLRLTGRELGE